jgi:hypothetical protein
MYDEMMRSFFEILLDKCQHKDDDLSQHREGEGEKVRVDQIDLQIFPSLPATNWRCVRDGSPLSPAGPEAPKTYENLFNWKAFTKKHRSEIVVKN